MACTPAPTQTLFEVVTTSTLSTSTSEIVTTIPPVLSTILSTFCGLETVDNGTTTCASTETTAIITTISSESSPLSVKGVSRAVRRRLFGLNGAVGKEAVTVKVMSGKMDSIYLVR